MVTLAALLAWALNLALGSTLLVRWARRHRATLPPLVFVHLGAAGLGFALWAVRLSGVSSALLAWAAFAVLTVTNILGDTVLTGGWRHRHPGAPGSAYLGAIVETLRFRRPLASTHALVAPVVYVLVLVAAVAAS